MYFFSKATMRERLSVGGPDDEVTATIGAIGVIAGAFVALWAAIPLVSRVRKRVGVALNPLSRVLEELDAVQRKLEVLTAEMRPNGGSTLRDSLDRVEASLELHTQRQRAAFTSMPVGVMETDHTGQVLWSNRRLSRVTGRTPRELHGVGWMNAMAPSCRSRIRECWDRAMETQTEFEADVEILTAAGELCKGTLQAMFMESSSHRFLGFILVVTEEGTR